MMAIRHQMSAMVPAAGTAVSGAALALVLGGLLLLSAPWAPAGHFRLGTQGLDAKPPNPSDPRERLRHCLRPVGPAPPI